MILTSHGPRWALALRGLVPAPASLPPRPRGRPCSFCLGPEMSSELWGPAGYCSQDNGGDWEMGLP